MLRYKTETRPGLVALYNIRPGNGAGPFLQPWSPHGAGDCDMGHVGPYHPCLLCVCVCVHMCDLKFWA